MSASSFSSLRVLLLAALACAAVGLRTRLALFASAAGFFLYYGTIHSSRKPPLIDRIGHLTDPVVFVLLILAVSPAIGLWGLDGRTKRGRWRLDDDGAAVIPAWPLQTVKLLLALVYFGAASCKWRSSLLWLDGKTLQTALLEVAMQGDAGASLWVAHRLWLCAAMSAAALMLESTFFVVLFAPRLAWLYAGGGLVMHALMWALMAKNYFPYFGFAYWAFLRWPAAPVPRAFATPLPRGHRAMAAALITALIAVNLVCIFGRFNPWPFASWRFFCPRQDYATLTVHRLQGVPRQGERRWLTASESRGAGLILQYTPGKGRARAALPDDPWTKEGIRRVINGLPRATARELRAVALVERTAVKSPDGRFEFVDRPLLEMRIEP